MNDNVPKGVWFKSKAPLKTDARGLAEAGEGEPTPALDQPIQGCGLGSEIAAKQNPAGAAGLRM